MLAGLKELGRLRVNLHPYDDMGKPDGVMTERECALFEVRFPELIRPFANLRVIASNFVPSNAVCIHPWRDPGDDGRRLPRPLLQNRMRDKSVFTFGNMQAAGFREVWDSESVWEMQRLPVEKSPVFCAGCLRHAKGEANDGILQISRPLVGT